MTTRLISTILLIILLSTPVFAQNAILNAFTGKLDFIGVSSTVGLNSSLCAANEILKKNAANDGWACGSDNAGGAGGTTIDVQDSGSAIVSSSTISFNGLLVATNSGGDAQVTIDSIDISSDTNLSAGTNITLTGDTLNVDDAFLINDGDDVTSGGVTFGTNATTINSDGSAVFNEQGAAVDFRIESDNNVNMVLVDGSTDSIHINGTTGVDTLNIHGDVDIIHTATGTDEHALELEVNAAAFGDVKAIDIVYMTGAISAGDDEGVIVVNTDQSAATGGEIYAIQHIATEGSANVYGMFSGALVNPILQESGSFVDHDYCQFTTSGAGEVDCLTASTSTGTDVTLFTADNDYIILGDAALFSELEFLLATVASGAGIAPTIQYSTGGSGFTTFAPVDGTNGMRNNGVIAWDPADIGSWATNTSGNYEIKIIRTRNSLSTVPIEDKIQKAATVEYHWDKDGSLLVKEVMFEGSTDDANQTLLTVTDPTGDQTITLPDKSGEVSLLGQTIDISNASNLSAGTNLTLAGDTLNVDDSFVSNAGDTMTGNLVLDDVNLQITEGADTMTISVPTLTTARAVTFPNLAGEVSLLGFSIDPTELSAADSPADGEVYSYRALGATGEWIAAGGGSGDVTDVGSCTTGACFTDGDNHTLIFEGTTVDTSEVTFSETGEPTEDVTTKFQASVNRDLVLPGIEDAGAITTFAGQDYMDLQNVSQAASTLDINARYIVLRDTNDVTMVAFSVDETISLIPSGVNGLDTGVVEDNTFYAIWVIAKEDGTVDGMFSKQELLQNITFPTDYVYGKRVGWVRNTSGANHSDIHQFGRMVYRDASSKTNSDLTDTTWSNVDWSGHVPPTAFIGYGTLREETGSATIQIRRDGSTSGSAFMATIGTTNESTTVKVPLGDGTFGNAQFWEINATSGEQYDIWVWGWEDNL
jgi:hypothetical protein